MDVTESTGRRVGDGPTEQQGSVKPPEGVVRLISRVGIGGSMTARQPRFAIAPPQVAGERVCTHAGCGTRLSRYNPRDACHLHAHRGTLSGRRP